MKLFGLSPKISGAIIAATMFFIISNPLFYQLVDDILGDTLGRISSPGGCPTTWGLVLHSTVFGLATYYGLGV